MPDTTPPEDKAPGPLQRAYLTSAEKREVRDILNDLLDAYRTSAVEETLDDTFWRDEL